MSNIHVVMLDKGGTGKTTFSVHALPILVGEGKKIKIYSVDTSNKNVFKEASFELINMTSKDDSNAVQSIVFDILSVKDKDETISILDVAGDDQTITGVLSALKDNNFKGLIYWLPVNSASKQVSNLISTLSAIIDFDDEAEINLVLNRAKANTPEGLMTQFFGVYGGLYGKIGLTQAEWRSIHKVYFVPDSEIFNIVEDVYSKTLYDAKIGFEELLVNRDIHRKKWAEAGKEAFFKGMETIHFAQDVNEFCDTLKKSTLEPGRPSA